MTIDLRDAASALSRKLDKASDVNAARWDGVRPSEPIPGWSEEIFSRLLLLLDGDPEAVRYATCKFDEGVGSAIIFTDQLVIIARSGSTDRGQVDAIAYRRSQVEAVRITESGTVLERGSAHWVPDWPGKVRVELTLSTQRESLCLPLVDNVKPENNEALIALIRGLVADLGTTRP